MDNDQCYRIQKDLPCNAKQGSTGKVVHHFQLLKTSASGLLCNHIMDHVTFIIQVNFLLEVTNLFLLISKQGKEIIFFSVTMERNVRKFLKLEA